MLASLGNNLPKSFGLYMLTRPLSSLSLPFSPLMERIYKAQIVEGTATDEKNFAFLISCHSFSYFLRIRHVMKEISKSFR